MFVLDQLVRQGLLLIFPSLVANVGLGSYILPQGNCEILGEVQGGVGKTPKPHPYGGSNMSLVFGYLSETPAGTLALGEKVAPSNFVGAAVTAQLWVGQAWRKLEAGTSPENRWSSPKAPEKPVLVLQALLVAPSPGTETPHSWHQLSA